MMLDADVQTGIVVDRNGAIQGLLTVEAIADKMREGEHAPAFDDLARRGRGDPGEAAPARRGRVRPAGAPGALPLHGRLDRLRLDRRHVDERSASGRSSTSS